MGLSPEKARQIRRMYPLHAAIGANGSGKSALIVYDSLPSLQMGRRLISTIRFLDWEDKRYCEGKVGGWGDFRDQPCDHEEHDGVPYRPGTFKSSRPVVCWQAHPLWSSWRSWEQLIDIPRDIDVVGDEMTGIASNADWALVPSRARDVLNQLRRRGCAFRWSVPFWDSCVADVKRVTMAATVCTGWSKVLGVRLGSGPSAGSPWVPNSVFRWLTFDARELDKVAIDEKRRAKQKRLAWAVMFGPGSAMFEAYESLDEVSNLAAERTCQNCGHRRRPEPTCKCPPEPKPVPVLGVARRVAS